MNRNAWWAKTKPASQKGGEPFGRPAPDCPPYRAAHNRSKPLPPIEVSQR